MFPFHRPHTLNNIWSVPYNSVGTLTFSILVTYSSFPGCWNAVVNEFLKLADIQLTITFWLIYKT